MSQDSTQSFKQAFGQYLKKNEKLEQQFNEKKLIHSWNEIMGEPIANRTTNIFIKDGVLVVKLSSAPLKQELNMAKEKVLELFEKKLGSQVVKEVRFI
ncbi:MAG: DUF721 domain-containing protein [Cytophagales bacterium]|nr:DUF721 domain-containing protein [Cytophagales bacterium]